MALPVTSSRANPNWGNGAAVNGSTYCAGSESATSSSAKSHPVGVEDLLCREVRFSCGKTFSGSQSGSADACEKYWLNT
jgi:hypothetical protein